MIMLTVEEILMLHGKLIKATGGSHGLRDMALLESAVLNVNGSFDDTEIYPTVEEKSAGVAYALIT